jgi:hypothetical protein
LYAQLCRRFADDPVAARILDRYGEGRGALALLGGLHFLVLGGEASWEDPLERHEDFLTEYVARQDVQTNEAQRSWVLLPLFLHAAGGAEVVDVIELGASAGLNLVFDRYRYEYEEGMRGPEDAALVLRGEERRPLGRALLERALNIRSRVGIDRAPIDVTTDEGVRLLESFVWPGQDERVERLHAAIEVVRAEPPRIVTGDIADVLPGLLEALPRDGLALVFQTGVFEYIAPDARARVREILERADRDLVFVASGRPRDEERAWGMRIYRPGRGHEFAGHADYHGTWLDYEL